MHSETQGPDTMAKRFSIGQCAIHVVSSLVDLSAVIKKCKEELDPGAMLGSHRPGIHGSQELVHVLGLMKLCQVPT